MNTRRQSVHAELIEHDREGDTADQERDPR